MKVAAAIGAALAFVALPVLVLAHAGLVTSDPIDGSTITTPYTLTATFEEAIDPELSTLTVENAAGEIVSSGVVDADDQGPVRMTAELPALPDGVYTVRWTTVTPDDTGIERGTFTFNVASVVASATPFPTPPPNDGIRDYSEDPIVAVGLAAIAIIFIVAFIFFRRRR